MFHSIVFKLMYGWIRLDLWLRGYSSLKWVGNDLQCSTSTQLVQSCSVLLHCRYPGVYFAYTAGNALLVIKGLKERFHWTESKTKWDPDLLVLSTTSFFSWVTAERVDSKSMAVRSTVRFRASSWNSKSLSMSFRGQYKDRLTFLERTWKLYFPRAAV